MKNITALLLSNELKIKRQGKTGKKEGFEINVIKQKNV